MLPGTAPELALARRCQCPNVLHFDLDAVERPLGPLRPSRRAVRSTQGQRVVDAMIEANLLMLQMF